MTAGPADMPELEDRVPSDAPGVREIGFSVPERYNASAILFDNLAAGRAHKPALVGAFGSVSYGELCAQASRIANALVSLGCEPGERVLLFLDDTPAYPAAIFGAMRAGLVPVLLNTQSTADLTRYYIEDSGARVAVVEVDFDDTFSDTVVAGTTLETLITVNGEAPTRAELQVRDGNAWFGGFPGTFSAYDTGADDMAFWMYSSGSTGRPKGVVHLHHDMAYTVESYARHLLKLTEDDICFSVPKIFFAYGFGNAITFPFAAGASTLLMAGRPTPSRVFDEIATHRPTVFFGLPTLYTAMIKDPAAQAADLSCVRMCISAAEVLSLDIFTSWREHFGHEIVEGLGSTEVLHIYLSNAPGEMKSGSAGRRVPGYEIVLTDPEGAAVPPGGEGVLMVRGHSTAPCYWNRPDKTAETMRDGWIWTGDRFHVDEDGFYFFKGRADDLIKVSGQWVHPLEIELCLAEHTSVRECAVMGIELPDRRMTTKAYVVLDAGVVQDGSVTRELQDFVKARLVPYKYPRLVEYFTELPKTGTGKIDRQALLKDDTDVAADA